LKWMATNACEELEATLPGGAGYNIWALISSFTNTNNYRPVNLGQLKYVAQPFYDRLIEVGYATNYPWSGQPNDYALANIGQMKNVFSFDVATWLPGDATGEGIPNWWKLQYGYSALTSATNVAANSWTLLQNFQSGTNPNLLPTVPAPQTVTISGQYVRVDKTKCHYFGFEPDTNIPRHVYLRLDELAEMLDCQNEVWTNSHSALYNPTNDQIIAESGQPLDLSTNGYVVTLQVDQLHATNPDPTPTMANWFTQSLSVPYTTAMLTNIAASVLENSDWQELNVPPEAIRTLSSNEVDCALQKLRYQFAFDSVTGQLYRVTWTERFVSQDGATTNDTIRTDWIVGTGASISTTNHLLMPPGTNGTVTVISLNPLILKPWGSAGLDRNPTNCWLADANRFDFQGVASNSPGRYALTIEGQVATGAGYLWSLSSSFGDVGMLTNTNNANPTHFPPASVAQDSGITGILQLFAVVDGIPTTASQFKNIVIYPDHLARDRVNFGPQLGKTCKNSEWSTPYCKIRIANPNFAWNCFGSVNHAYDGTGDGYTNGPPPCVTNWVKVSLRYPFDTAATNAINGMKRGDVVVYHSTNFLGQVIIQHAATSIGGSMTWGANNGSFLPTGAVVGGRPIYIASWIWAQGTAYDVAKDYDEHWSPPLDGIDIYTRP
jgi:hypothetical protein